MRAALVEGKPPSMYPIRGIFVGCCASARWTEARAKAISKTTTVLVRIPALFTAVHCRLSRTFFLARRAGNKDCTMVVATPVLPAGYVVNASRIADRRMILAGYRLVDLMKALKL